MDDATARVAGHLAEQVHREATRARYGDNDGAVLALKQLDAETAALLALLGGDAEVVEDLNFRRSKPQVIEDHWRHRYRLCMFDGICPVCGTRTYTFTDGENDPRGMLGDHAGSSLDAHDEGYEEIPEGVVVLPTCFGCMNDEPRYRAAQELLRQAVEAWGFRQREEAQA